MPASHEGDTAEWRLVADGELRAAQLRVPVAWVLAQETRRSAYATAVAQLASALEDAVG